MHHLHRYCTTKILNANRRKMFRYFYVGFSHKFLSCVCQLYCADKPLMMADVSRPSNDELICVSNNDYFLPGLLFNRSSCMIAERC